MAIHNLWLNNNYQYHIINGGNCLPVGISHTNVKPRPHLTYNLQAFGQRFVKPPKYLTNMFVECLVGIDVFPNNFICQCLKQN
jgi:hypothetical protein